MLLKYIYVDMTLARSFSKATVVEMTERRDGARMGFPERVDVVLN